MIKVQRGTKDILPSDVYKWHYVENVIRKISSKYGYTEIRTPIFEATELFERGVGDTTDVVQKEMYTFLDKGNRSITLRPENTAGVVRSYIENSMYSETQPIKLYYIGQMFRYEGVQKGRLRQFNQFGIEVLGGQEPSIDAEVIDVVVKLLKYFNINDVKVAINSIGCPKCRSEYNKKLIEFLNSKKGDLCKICNERLYKNPLRILDCKEEKCNEIVSEAPTMIEYLCDECKSHFEGLKKYLKVLNITYEVDEHIVRGLDYYTKTVFEVIYNGLTVCGGGRYDNLGEILDGPHIPAIGFALGIERLLMIIEETGYVIPKDEKDLYICSMGDNAYLKAMSLSSKLRDLGINCEVDHMKRSVKSQMKFANKLNFRYTFVIGDNEINSSKANLKNMDSGETIEVNIDEGSNSLVAIKNIISGGK